MTKLMAVFGVLGAVNGETVSAKTQVEIDPGDFYERPESTIRNAETVCAKGLELDVLFVTYYEGTTEVEE